MTSEAVVSLPIEKLERAQEQARKRRTKSRVARLHAEAEYTEHPSARTQRAFEDAYEEELAARADYRAAARRRREAVNGA